MTIVVALCTEFIVSSISAITSRNSAISVEFIDLILLLIPLKAGNKVLGVLCLRIEHGVSWFASEQRMQEEEEEPGEQATFFWTFLDQAIMVIERARLRARARSTNEEDKKG